MTRLPGVILLALLLAFAGPAFAQDDTRSYEDIEAQQIPAQKAQDEEGTISPEVQAIIDTPEAPVVKQGEITPPTEQPAPPEDAAEPKKPEYEDMPQVELRILDKVRAESRTYVLNVGRTVAYANIRIRPRACRKSSPLDNPENAAFLQIWEVKPDGISAWIFSGWMFASSPSLSAMDHPVYDVTVMNCKNPEAEAKAQAEEEAAAAETAPETETVSEPGADPFSNEALERDSADSSID